MGAFALIAEKLYPVISTEDPYGLKLLLGNCLVEVIRSVYGRHGGGWTEGNHWLILIFFTVWLY